MFPKGTCAYFAQVDSQSSSSVSFNSFALKTFIRCRACRMTGIRSICSSVNRRSCTAHPTSNGLLSICCICSDKNPLKSSLGAACKDELKERGMTQKQLAAETGIKPSVLSETINGKRSVSLNVAVSLEKALGIPADVWMILQTQYDLDTANIAERLGTKNGYNGYARADFIKAMFPDVMKDIEQDSIRNFKFQPNKGSIVIDEPNEDDYHFHIK